MGFGNVNKKKKIVAARKKTKENSIIEKENKEPRPVLEETLKSPPVQHYSPVIANAILDRMMENPKPVEYTSDYDSDTVSARSKKQKMCETVREVEERLSRENYKARVELFSVMEPDRVDVPPSTIDTEELKRKYMDYCKKIGTMDCDNDIKEEVKRVTKKYGWKSFKILDKEDYKWDSVFAGMILKKLGIVENNPNTTSKFLSRKWDSIKKDVISSMQAVKSSATQSMKRSFLGTF